MTMKFPFRIGGAVECSSKTRMDADTELFLHNFDEPKGSRVLEVGANEENSANILVKKGYNVVGVDLRPYLQDTPCKYEHIQGDFCELAPSLGLFDAVYSLSAIEHFGLGTYPNYDPSRQLNCDIVAMSMMRMVLKPRGVCYITVPFGKKFIVEGHHWRVYNSRTLSERIIQKFKVERMSFFTSGAAKIGTENRSPYKPVSPKEAAEYSGVPPHVTVILKMRN